MSPPCSIAAFLHAPPLLPVGEEQERRGSRLENMGQCGCYRDKWEWLLRLRIVENKHVFVKVKKDNFVTGKVSVVHKVDKEQVFKDIGITVYSWWDCQFLLHWDHYDYICFQVTSCGIRIIWLIWCTITSQDIHVNLVRLLHFCSTRTSCWLVSE